MKAVIVTFPGDPEVLQIQERDTPEPASNEVLVRVHAAGINRPDILQRKGKYPPPPGAPADIPGLEIAGTIEKLGDQVSKWKVGDAVCALLAGGGYAEYAVVNADHCLPVPSGWTFAEAASLPETIFTVWHNAFRLGSLKSGEHFLVHGGSSGIGITAIQLAKAFGAKVFATAGSEEKCQACRDLGADIAINYNATDFESTLQELGVDVILDMIGGDYIGKNIRLLRTDGRLVFINTMKGSKSADADFSLLMRNRLTITGSTLRNRNADFKTALTNDIVENVWPILEAGKFKPVIYRELSLDQAAEAHALMESSAHIGKIVLNI